MVLSFFVKKSPAVWSEIFAGKRRPRPEGVPGGEKGGRRIGRKIKTV
jgi:hypothetical protein